MSKKKDGALADSVWHDRDVLFDLDTRLLRVIPGEILIERIDHVEDTKGNNGDRGILRITNLRVVWYAMSAPRINLSVGYNSITGITTKMAKSKLRGQWQEYLPRTHWQSPIVARVYSESLYIMAKGLNGTKFEFVFTCVNPVSTKMFTTVIGIHRAYETSKMYREMRMRNVLLNEDEKLKLLPLETQCDKLDGVWNLSSEQGNLGAFIFTNVRVVWYAVLNPLYNVSIPYLQLKSCKVRNSRFGRAVVLESSLQSGEYILGFQLQEDRMQDVCHQVQALAQAYQLRPIFGVTYTREHSERTLDPGDNDAQLTDDDASEVERKPLRVDAFAAYFTEGPTKNTEPRPIVYSEELGVAIEQLKPGFTIADLWEINID